MYHHELDAVGDGVLGGVADADADACARERERRAALRRSARKEGLMGEALQEKWSATTKNKRVAW
jgi:hypothetical protein